MGLIIFLSPSYPPPPPPPKFLVNVNAFGEAHLYYDLYDLP